MPLPSSKSPYLYRDNPKFVNVGTIGHVDHRKRILTTAIQGLLPRQRPRFEPYAEQYQLDPMSLLAKHISQEYINHIVRAHG